MALRIMSVDHYSRSMGDIQALFRSRLQIQILLSLADGNKTLAQLRDITGSSSQALIPRIRRLESSNLMAISDYEYHLSPIGDLLTKKMQDIILFKLVTTKHKSFWDQHFSDEIPEEFLSTIGDLYISEIIADTNVEIFNVYFNFLKIIQEAEQIYILTPISSLAHMHAVMKRISEGAYVETLVGKDLFEQLSTSPDFDKIHELSTHTKSKIFVLDKPPRLGLTVTDKHISLGLYKNDGIFDTTTDLFSVDEKAINWGRRLYQHYRDDAIELIL
jgi:predicted transcriptional regulator